MENSRAEQVEGEFVRAPSGENEEYRNRGSMAASSENMVLY